MNQKVVTRFAPSPTGFLHVGGVRTALYAYLWAKKNNGTFILRIEDTDKEREVEGSISHIQEVLKWLGIVWDEGPSIDGPHAPYLQSQRLDLYKKYAQILIEKGLAYPDPYTEETVEEFRKKAEKDKRPFLYREYRPASPSQGGPANFEIWDGTKPLRFKVPEIKRYEWHDLVYGDMHAGPEALDDFILIKKDGYPTYNFAHIVDDIEMGVTHVMRGQEFISSVPKFLSLYQALDIKPPFFATLPPIMGPDGKKKLSKRDGAKDALEYKDEGYLPEAMINFLALLGWHPEPEQSSVRGKPCFEKEIFSVSELIEAFEVERIQHSGAQWNEEKLDWINKEHMKKLSEEELIKKIFELLPVNLHNNKIIPLIFERISKFGDVKTMLIAGELDYFMTSPKYEKERLAYKDVPMTEIFLNLKKALDALTLIPEEEFNREKIKEVLMEEANKIENRGAILHPVRFALTGLEKSPDPFVVAEILGKNETIARLQKAF